MTSVDKTAISFGALQGFAPWAAFSTPEEIYVALLPGRDDESICRFDSFTCDRHAWAGRRHQCRTLLRHLSDGF
jgi:hypothetical protein